MIRSAVVAALLAIPTLALATPAPITGTVHETIDDGSVVWLVLDDTNETRVALLMGWLSNFPTNPATHYRGKRISVQGPVTPYRGRPEIRVRDAAAIAVLDEPAAGDQPRSAAPAATEVDTLRQQIRALQERVEELERKNPQ